MGTLLIKLGFYLLVLAIFGTPVAIALAYVLAHIPTGLLVIGGVLIVAFVILMFVPDSYWNQEDK